MQSPPAPLVGPASSSTTPPVNNKLKLEKKESKTGLLAPASTIVSLEARLGAVTDTIYTATHCGPGSGY